MTDVKEHRTDVDSYWQHLEDLAEAEQLRAIEIVPKQTTGTSLLDFIEHMQAHHNHEFAGRFSFVLLALMYFHPRCTVFVDADEDRFYNSHPGLARDLDVHDASPTHSRATSAPPWPDGKRGWCSTSPMWTS